MKRDSIASRCLLILLMVSMILSGCSNQVLPVAESTAAQPREVAAVAETVAQETAEETLPAEPVPEETIPTETASQETEQGNTKMEISVAMYPHIPNVELFERVLRQKWAELEPDVPLTIEHWDCYAETSDCDVLMYDTLVLSYLAENGYIHPLQKEDIQDADDLLPFVMEGVTHEGVYYGVPYFVCGDFLIYYSDDTEMAAVKNFSQLYALVESRRQTDPATGVLMNFQIDYPYHYLEAYVDFTEEYTTFEEMPDCYNPDPRVMQCLEDLDSVLASVPEGTEGTNGELFNDGYGFGYYGVSEHLVYMEEILEQLEITNISLASGENIPLFYTDVTSIASHVTEPKKLELCRKLMNMVGSKDFLETQCFENGKPQYLLPARKSVYLAAAEKYPIYGKLYEMVMREQNKVFRFGVDFYEYMEIAREEFA